MPLLIILLAWRLVIESFQNILRLSSRCMQIEQMSFPAVRFVMYVKEPHLLFSFIHFF